MINQATAEIKASGNGIRSLILQGKEYAFLQNTSVVETEHSYTVEYAKATYTVYFTQLPIIHLTTKQPVKEDTSVYAAFTMSETSGKVNTSNVGLEIRGGFSRSYAKKSYKMTLWNDTLGTSTRELGLLQMRADEKWNLQALYNEPLRVNSKVANELWQEIHQIYYKDREPDAKNGIDMAYVEVFLNGEYQGLYTLGERIDRKQLKLKKYSTSPRGELYKATNWGAAVLMTGAPAFDNTSALWDGFEYKYPDEKVDWTNLHDFVDFVATSSDATFYSQYKTRFRLDNAVDYYIFLNLLRARDNAGKNLYIAKYTAGEPYYYVPWDLDGVFGNSWSGEQDPTTDDILSNGFYQRLNQDCSATGFRATLARRWAALRTTVITEDHILAKFRASNNYLVANNMYQREHAAWDTYNYDETQLTYVATWLRSRLAYLDKVFGQSCTLLSTTPGQAQATAAINIYPNPASDYLTVEVATGAYTVCIQDMSGRVVATATVNTQTKQLAISHLAKGMYVVTLKGNNYFKAEKLLLN